MNRNILSIALALVVMVIGLGSIGCAPSPDTNRDAGLVTNRNTRAEPVDTAAIEADLKKLEKEWANAYKTKDVATVKRVLADDVVLVYPDGSPGNKESEVQFAETGAFSATSWEVLDEKVTVIDADAAFMTGRTVIKEGKLKDPRTQKMIDISGEYRFLDVYAKKSGAWQVVASQATKIEAPTPAAAASASPAKAASPAASPAASKAAGPPPPPAKATPTKQ